MHIQVGGPSKRLGMALVASLLLVTLLAGCTTVDERDQVEALPEPEPGNGIVTIWMKRPENVDRYGVVMLTAVPRFVSFHAADNETATRLNDTAGYVGVAKGWHANPSGWGTDEWPKSAEKNWLRHDIWYQDQVPAGKYEMIRVEFLDAQLFVGRSQPNLFIGNTNPSSGNMRLGFYAAAGEPFHVQEGEELVITFDSALVPEGQHDFLIR